MAMRPRGGGRGGPGTRPHRAPRPGVRPVYEDFRPVFERHQEEGAEKLLIFLPGFFKESLRVSTEGKNTVRVRGEQFVEGNKWNRFQEDYQAPENCNMRGIHAKFENGILIITMPCKMPKQLLDEHTKQPPLTTPPPPHKDDDVPPKTSYPPIETPRKPTPLKPTAQLPKPQNADKDQVSRVQEKQREEEKIFDDPLKSAETSKSQKGDEIIDFPALGKTPVGKTSGEREKTKDEKKILEGGKKVAEKSKELIGEIQEKVEQKGPKEKQSASNLAAGTSSYHGSEFSIDNLKKSFLGQNEERQLLVNAGAAVLVIMALGAYVYHSIGSGRAK
ncbi:inactive protein RESTRICTED TEV MOVEMENT 2 [Lycium barbarum]|uniref:inactive protein RESTRICTED TEV MOVEMENT 2 n=1 Tax=Lycium barbarum TaxID=112863 RepID=UPI00293E9113|nr:inactive protein RESTRICTED TEV MOVEMENT 2 [Lycium barbarum]